MTALAQVISRATGAQVDAPSLGAAMIACGIALLVALLATQTYGLDLSYCFF